MTDKNKTHWQGNQYAKKDKVKTSQIQIRCTTEQKALFVRALRDNEKLSDFMLDAANAELSKRNA